MNSRESRPRSLGERAGRGHVSRPTPTLARPVFDAFPWAAGLLFGLAAESVQWGLTDPRHYVPDLAVGWVFIGGGLLAAQRRRDSHTGALMVATGFTWFFGNFARLGVPPIDVLAAHALVLYLGPLVHVLLTYPEGRLSSPIARLAVGVGYLAAVVGPIWQNDPARALLAGFVLTVAARRFVLALGRERGPRRVALWTTAGWALALGGYSVLQLLVSPADASAPFILAYEGTLCAIALALLRSLLSRIDQSTVTDLVVELGQARSRSLREELSRALADPTLEIGYWLPGAEAYVDADGLVVSVPKPGSPRVATTVEQDGRPIAVLVHDLGVLSDPGLSEAIAAATQLAASNVRLQAEVRTRLEEVRSSRRRILDAGDEERARLERRLHEAVERRLTKVADDVREAEHAVSPGSSATIAKIDRARRQVDETIEEIEELGHGLHPRILGEQGLERALVSVVERSAVPVELSVRADDLPPSLAATVYFVCSEAVANVVKYSGARRAAISVVRDARTVTVEVVDDGVGGARVTSGSGLQGLRDRIEALGGAMLLESPAGKGTRIWCDLPIAPVEK